MLQSDICRAFDDNAQYIANDTSTTVNSKIMEHVKINVTTGSTATCKCDNKTRIDPNQTVNEFILNRPFIGIIFDNYNLLQVIKVTDPSIT